MSALKAVDDTVSADQKNSGQVLKEARSNEIFVAVVGPAGAGAGTAASVLAGYLGDADVNGDRPDVVVIKASEAIRDWAEKQSLRVPETGKDTRKSLSSMMMMQDRGDEMRKHFNDNAAVARAAIFRIRSERASRSDRPLGQLDGKPRAYVIDSLRHPAEAHLLRRLYQDAFYLVGVVCTPDERQNRS